MEYNHSGEPERFARMAQAFGLDTRGVTLWRAAEMAVEYVHQLTIDVEIPSMQELGFSEGEIPMLAQKAFDDPQTIGNPRDVNKSGYERIYRQAFALGEGGRPPRPLAGEGSGVRGNHEPGEKKR